jgi:hypothetical protein
MTDITTSIDPRARRRDRPSIALPNGDTLEPRSDFAARLSVSERTVQRMKLPTIYVANVAHHPVNECLNILTGRIQRPEQPRKQRPRAASR